MFYGILKKEMALTETLKNFYLGSSWQSLLTAILFSRLILRVSHWFFIRAELEIRKFWAENEKTAGFVWICFLSRKEDNKYWQKSVE